MLLNDEQQYAKNMVRNPKVSPDDDSQHMLLQQHPASF